MSGRVRQRAIEGAKVLHVVRIAEDFWGQARPWMVTAVYAVSTSRMTTKT